MIRLPLSLYVYLLPGVVTVWLPVGGQRHGLQNSKLSNRGSRYTQQSIEFHDSPVYKSGERGF